MFVALLRHGIYAQPPDVPSAHLPHPLTHEGEEQARAAVQQLLDVATDNAWAFLDTLDSSTLLRAWQTAQLVSQGLATHLQRVLHVTQFDELSERCVGSAANLSVPQLERVLQLDPRVGQLPADWRRDGSFRIPLPGAETMHQAGQRVARHLEHRAKQVADGIRVDTLKLFVGHGGSFRYAAVHLGVLDATEVGNLSMAHCAPVFLERHADGRWEHVAGEWKVREAEEEAVD